MADNLFPETYGAGGASDLDNLAVKLRDENGAAYGIKHTNNKVKVVDIAQEHQFIHQGLMFFTGYYWSSIANAGTAVISFHAGTVMPHVFFDVACGGDVTMTVYEGGTITGGTALTIGNHLRSSSNVPSGSAKHSGTLTGGTAFPTEFIPGGGKNFGSGGSKRSEHEIIGLQSTVYTLNIINVSGDTKKVSVSFNFYEENE